MVQDAIINKSYDAVSKLISFSTDNRDRILKSIINSILLVVIFAIFGCFDFLTLSFHFEYLTQVSFWTSVISKAVAGGICANAIGINFQWDREIKKDILLAEQADKYQRLNKTKDQKTFNEFVVNVYNRNEKKKAYISQINAKIYRLNKFARNKDKLLYSQENKEQEKLKNRYCRKRKELEDIKTDEYINKNFDNIKVRYCYVDPLVFDLEIDGKVTYKGTRVIGSVASGKTKAISTAFMSMIGVSILLTSIGLGADQQQFANEMIAFWHYLLTICEDVGIILWQLFKGILITRKIVSNEITLPIVNRNKVLTEYNDWCIENNIEKSKSYQVYQKILESEVKVNA